MVPQYNLTGGSMAKTTGRTNLLIASGFQHEAPSDVVSFPAEILNKSAKPNSDILIYIHSMTDEEAYRSTEVSPLFLFCPDFSTFRTSSPSPIPSLSPPFLPKISSSGDSNSKSPSTSSFSPSDLGASELKFNLFSSSSKFNALRLSFRFSSNPDSTSNASNLAKSTSGNEIRSSIELTGGFSGALPGFFKRLKPRFWTTGDGSSDGENS
nr:hypothetical protein Iba_chr01eCG3130 [Ipomoea batatas]